MPVTRPRSKAVAIYRAAAIPYLNGFIGEIPGSDARALPSLAGSGAVYLDHRSSHVRKKDGRVLGRNPTEQLRPYYFLASPLSLSTAALRLL